MNSFSLLYWTSSTWLFILFANCLVCSPSHNKSPSSPLADTVSVSALCSLCSLVSLTSDPSMSRIRAGLLTRRLSVYSNFLGKIRKTWWVTWSHSWVWSPRRSTGSGSPTPSQTRTVTMSRWVRKMRGKRWEHGRGYRTPDFFCFSIRTQSSI